MRRESLFPEAPGRRDIVAAAKILRTYADPSPMVRLLDSDAGEVHAKLETFSPTGSFKWRGVVYRLSRLSAGEKRRGVITASTGNHGFAVGWAAARLGIPATVVLPRLTPAFKRTRILRTGASVLVRGGDWNGSLRVARRLAHERGLVPIEDGEDPVLMAGTATLGSEILEQVPKADMVVAPVGGGNLIAAIACALESAGSDARLVGVQSSAARGAYDSWKRGRIVERTVRTLAGGIATAGPVPFAFDIMRRRVDAMHLVSDKDLMRAVGRLAVVHGVVVEPAGAAAFAGLPRIRKPGSRIVVVLTGRTIDPWTLAAAVATQRGKRPSSR